MIDTDPALFDGGRKLPLVEDFYTIQGEGFHAGKPAYFIRLGGCDVGCRWCDAKYTWNPRRYPPVDVQVVIDRALACPARAIVITGGEPLLYPLDILTRTLHDRGLQIFLETSGTHPFSGRFDWVCLAQTAATAAGRSLPASARVEGDRRAGGRPAMGRTERRPRRRRLPALPPTRMERLRTDDAAAGRICEGPSAVEHLDPDAQIHAHSLTR